MNLRSQAGKTKAATFDGRVAAWLDLLSCCGEKPTRKRVHALRVATLRLQAELERDITELPHATHQAQAMIRFGKQAEKLREALGPAREIDVWISKLRGLRASIEKPGDYVPRTFEECVRGIDRLEERLKRKRKAAGKKLAASIEEKIDRYGKAAEDLRAASDESRLPDARGIAEELIADFSRGRAEFPVLDEANLHDFRRRIKTVRYLAELHAGVDRDCARIATQMKKLQGAIGEWHDWQALAVDTRGVHHAWSKPLAELLESLSRETFEAALATAQSVTLRMLGEDAEQVQRGILVGGKRPAAVEGGPRMEEQKLA
jgi:CHAD domain-containing protein